VRAAVSPSLYSSTSTMWRITATKTETLAMVVELNCCTD
jgi:hypothetical protein